MRQVRGDCGHLKASYDNHTDCRRCCVAKQNDCSQSNPCEVSSHWSQDTWRTLSSARSYASRKPSRQRSVNRAPPVPTVSQPTLSGSDSGPKSTRTDGPADEPDSLPSQKAISRPSTSVTERAEAPTGHRADTLCLTDLPQVADPQSVRLTGHLPVTGHRAPVNVPLLREPCPRIAGLPLLGRHLLVDPQVRVRNLLLVGLRSLGSLGRLWRRYLGRTLGPPSRGSPGPEALPLNIALPRGEFRVLALDLARDLDLYLEGGCALTMIGNAVISASIAGIRLALQPTHGATVAVEAGQTSCPWTRLRTLLPPSTAPLRRSARALAQPLGLPGRTAVQLHCQRPLIYHIRRLRI